MMNSNAGKISSMITVMWKLIGYTGVVLRASLEGILIPLHRGKGLQKDPSNSRPFKILSRIRKITEKAVSLEFDRAVTTDKAQFGFQAGIQIL